jgi:hypothetical protein
MVASKRLPNKAPPRGICDVHPIPGGARVPRRGHEGGCEACRRRDGVRVFRQFAGLKVGSVRVALSRPAWLSTGEAVSRHTSGYPYPLTGTFGRALRRREPLGAAKLIHEASTMNAKEEKVEFTHKKTRNHFEKVY